MKSQRQMELAFVVLLLAALSMMLSGCTRLHVKWQSGAEVTAWGGMMVNREGSIKVTDSWLDPQTNILHETTIEQFGKENTDGQGRLLEKLVDKIPVTPAKGAGL
jgi:ABC-type glycerol-3-phosphate transport system substrate-binding protein